MGEAGGEGGGSAAASETPAHSAAGDGPLVPSAPNPLALTDGADAATSLAASMHVLPAAVGPVTSSGTSIAAPTDAEPKQLTFDFLKANTLVANEDWHGLDAYICDFIAAVTGKSPEEVGVLHPSLVFIPREKIVNQLLLAAKFEDAQEFYVKSLKPLKECSSIFKPIDMVWCVSYIEKLVIKRCANKMKCERVETAVADYINLYFPAAVGHNDELPKGLWQFVKKLSKRAIVGAKHGTRQSLSCLACKWVAPSAKGVSIMKPHFLHAQNTKWCKKVTEDILNRLKATDNSIVLPDMEKIANCIEVLKRKTTSTTAADNQMTDSPEMIGMSHSGTLSASKKLKVMDRDCILQKVDRLQTIGSLLSTNVRSSMSGSVLDGSMELIKEHTKLVTELKLEYLSTGFLSAPAPSLHVASNGTSEEPSATGATVGEPKAPFGNAQLRLCDIDTFWNVSGPGSYI